MNVMIGHHSRLCTDIFCMEDARSNAQLGLGLHRRSRRAVRIRFVTLGGICVHQLMYGGSGRRGDLV